MKKIGILALALVLALGSLGVGYALWSDVLYLEGTVQTGTVSADWSLEGYGDIEGKDWVSYVDAYIIGDTLYVVVYNAYPSVTYWVDFDVTNTGSIPIWICDLIPGGEVPPGTFAMTDVSNRQVEPQTSEYGTITIHMDNTAIQGYNYFFWAALPVVQYNEAVNCGQVVID